MCVWGEGVLEMSVTPLEHFPINNIYFAEGTSINTLINKLPCSFLIIHFFFQKSSGISRGHRIPVQNSWEPCH